MENDIRLWWTIEDIGNGEAVKTIKNMGYTEAEALNILEGKNYDGSEFIALPF